MKSGCRNSCPASLIQNKKARRGLRLQFSPESRRGWWQGEAQDGSLLQGVLSPETLQPGAASPRPCRQVGQVLTLLSKEKPAPRQVDRSRECPVFSPHPRFSPACLLASVSPQKTHSTPLGPGSTLVQKGPLISKPWLSPQGLRPGDTGQSGALGKAQGAGPVLGGGPQGGRGFREVEKYWEKGHLDRAGHHPELLSVLL